ncbi:hypothetical protein KQX54_001220 [Cotesia glomerata]|uniref:Uncharacterized protein n=1 Tax=Cotesia glomerata TaxID=32391 RepID=A0AAV7IST9_COTGL|nr:hypothetical protein KQX54_001220 [Cotesia glomerata]
MTASRNYTQALLTENVLFKEQAIILDSVDGVQIHEYAVASGSKIGPENIRHLSRIANNRICIYLSTKEVADNLIENHKTVKNSNSYRDKQHHKPTHGHQQYKLSHQATKVGWIFAIVGADPGPTIHKTQNYRTNKSC